MRTALVRPAVLRLALAVAPLAACARAAAPPPAAAGGPPPSVEEVRYRARADSLRARLLAAGSWAELGEDECHAGALRAFGGDTTAAASRKTEELVEELERVIIARGIDTPLDTPAGRALLRTIVLWEADLARPRWDVRAGEEPRPAIAAGLAGRFKNPATGRCESYVAEHGHTVVLPDGVDPARLGVDTARVQLVVGEAGLKAARDQFFARSAAGDPILTYSRVRVAVVWDDYAVVAVNRPAENRGVVELRTGAGGASYIFRRAGDEWRLLAIARTWA